MIGATMTSTSGRKSLVDKHYYDLFLILQQARTPRELIDLVKDYPDIIVKFLVRFQKDEYFQGRFM